MKLSEIQLKKQILIQGSSGTGKTHLEGTCAVTIPSVFITADPDGLTTLQSMDILPETEFFLLENWDDSWKMVEQVTKHVMDKKPLAILLDDMTVFQDKALLKGMFTPKDSDERRMNKDAFNAMVREQLAKGNRRLEQQARGNANTAVDAVLRELVNLPAQVKMVSVLESSREHPRSGQEHLFPLLEGGLREELASRFSLVVNTFVAQYGSAMYYCATSRPNSRIETKDRFGNPRTWVNPTASALIQHMNRKEAPETDLEKAIGIGTIASPGRS